MRHLRNNQGFTLIELVTSLAAASIVFGAASMLMLMGVRTQRDVLDAAKEQQTARTVLAMLENLASDGTIQMVETTEDGWNLRAKAPEAPADSEESGDEEGLAESEETRNLGEILLSYNIDSGALLIDGNVLIDGLNTAHAELNGQMLTFSFETPLNAYSTSVYCRLLKYADMEGDEDIDKEDKLAAGDISGVLKDLLAAAEATQKAAFLKTLCGEYGSGGKIMTGTEAGKYYAQWYDASWPASTPWCGCYLSWAAQKSLSNPPKFADVDAGKAWFETNSRWKETGGEIGDYIFFDWEAVSGVDADGRDDPDHVGVVLFQHNGIIYTIEGNSGGRVAIRSYHQNDPRILGYGVMLWNMD